MNSPERSAKRERRPLRAWAVALAAVIGAAGFAPQLAHADSYALITPYDDPGMETNVTGINDAGYMTGTITDSKGRGPAFVLDPEGNYTPFADPRMVTTEAGAINNNNDVAGNTLDYQKNTQASAEFIRTDSGDVTDVVNPKNGARLHGQANGLNDAGVVVGDLWRTKNGVKRQDAFIDTGDKLVDLPLGVRASATGINNAGEVVGWAGLADGQAQGFVYRAGKYELVGDPNAAAGDSTYLEAISNNGEAVGQWTDASGASHPFTYDIGANTFTELAPPASDGGYAATGVNDSGQVVLNNGAGSSVLYTPSVAPEQVVYASTLPAGIPEPATWAMLILGVALLGGEMRRRRGFRHAPRRVIRRSALAMADAGDAPHAT